KEKPCDESPKRTHSGDLMRSAIVKILFKKLNSLPEERLLPIHEVQGAFENATGESLKSYWNEFSDVISELSDKLYIQHKQRGPSGMPLFFKGLQFDAWMDEMMTKKESMSNTFNFHAAVGAVQTGENSVAHVQQSFDQSQLAGLKAALEAVHVELTKANLSDDVREAKELVQITIAEVDKDEPNKFSLKSLIIGVATTIQTLGSTGEAYNLLKLAASAAGILIP
ncbi:MAG: hypothetical protein ACAH07_02535, partial [Methylophilaceae bacterium]